MNERIRRFLTSTLIAATSATIGIARAADGLTDHEMDQVTGGSVASAADMSDFFAARAEAVGSTANASAHADDVSARARGSAHTLAPDAGNARSRAETVGIPPPPPPPQQEPAPVRLQMGDLWDRHMGHYRLPFTWLR
jgi:hypothetical protein